MLFYISRLGSGELFLLCSLAFVLLFIMLLVLRRRKNISLEILRRLFVGAFLAILIPLAMIYGIKTFMPGPSAPEHVNTWKWKEKLKKLEQEGKIAESKKLKNKIVQKEQEYKEKFKQFEKDMTKYIRIRRIIATSIGVVGIIFGALLADYFLGAGFIVGGALCIADATAQWWYKLSEAVRFSIIIGALFLLFIIGYLLVRRARKKM